LKKGTKKNKFRDLLIEIQHMLNVKADMIPIIDATGSLSQSFQNHLEYIPDKHSSMELQKAAIVGTVQILGRSSLISDVFSISCHVMSLRDKV
jgi:hypothetical protein